MSDRLAELVRQRALVQEHLAWLNREIAAAAEVAKAAPAPSGAANGPAPEATGRPMSVPAHIPPTAARTPVANAPDAVDPDEIIARYQVAPGAMKQDVRKGCLLYFAGAFLLLGLVVAVLYLAIGRKP
jgi:hypothetical protein